MCDNEKTGKEWGWIFNTGSAYFPGEPFSKLELGDHHGMWRTLTTLSNIKNYDQEIESFLTWLQPYVKVNHEEYFAHAYSKRPLGYGVRVGGDNGPKE